MLGYANKKSTYVYGVIFTAIYLGIVIFFHKVNVWENYFSEYGMIYLGYHLARIALLGYIAWLLFYTGKIFFNWFSHRSISLSFIEKIVIYSHLGAFLYIITFIGLGYLKLYYLNIALLLTFPVLFISFPQWQKSCFHAYHAIKCHYREVMNYDGMIYKSLLVIITLLLLIQWGYLFLIKGIMPGLGSNDDWWQYYPYIQDMVEKYHGIVPNHWYMYQNFISNNGGGIYVLMALLSDVFSMQMISFYFFSLILLLIYKIFQQMTDNILWYLLAVIIIISSVEVLSFEFYKNHIILNAFLIVSLYITIIYEKLKSYDATYYLQFILLATAIIISPLAFAFAVPIIFIHYFTWRKISGITRYTLLLLLSTSFVFMSMLLINYLTLGMAELIPFNLFVKFANFDIVKTWLDPFTLLVIKIFRIPIAQGDMNLSNILGVFSDPSMLLYPLKSVFYDSKMTPYYIYVGVGMIALWGWLRGWFHIENKGLYAPLLLLVFTFLLIIVTTQFSIFRFSFFRVYFKVIIYLSCFIFVLKMLKINNQKLIELFLISVLFCYPLLKFKENFTIVGSDLTSFVKTFSVADFYTNAPKFFIGTVNYADLYEGRWGYVKLGLNIQQMLGDEKIMALNPLVGLYCIPHHHFQQGHMADYVKGGQYQTLLLGTPEAAKLVLQQNQLNYFFIDLRAPVWYTVYSPLFQAKNLQQYFKPVLLSEDKNVAVLTWKDSIEEPNNLAYQQFIQKYKQAKIKSKSMFYSKTYEALLQVLPDTPLTQQQLEALIRG